MPLGVNTNIASNSIISQLDMTQNSFNTEVKRLSSGLRINSAADDPSGLVTATNYEAESEGLNQAVSNAQDSIGLTQTADGALSTVSSLLTQMRDLALQAANTGPNDQASIAADQQQITASIQTINTIANTTQFGTRQLLNGDSGVAGTTDNANVNFVSGSAASVSGTYAVSVTTAATQGSVSSSAARTVASLDSGTAGNAGTTTAASTLTLSGALVGSSPVVLSLASGASISDVQNAINQNSTLSAAGISASVSGAGDLVISSATLSGGGASELTAQSSTAELAGVTGVSNTAAVDASTANATNGSELRNSEILTFTNGSGSNVNVALNAGQQLSAAVSQINSALQTAGIGVTASFSNTTSEFSITNNAFGSSATVGNTFSSNLAASASGATQNFGIDPASGQSINIASGSGVTNHSAGTDVAGTIGGNAATGSGQVLTGSAGTPVAGVALSVAGNQSGSLGNVTVSQDSLTMQIGAFAGQTATLSLGNTSAVNLGTTAVGTTTMGNNVNVSNIDVTKNNGAGAQDALLVLDAAIQQVSTVRANLGAFQSDILQSSVNNLQNEQQNISSAESQVQDANLAQESVTFSKDQILQQTGMSMLAQANQAPQLLLKLFQ